MTFADETLDSALQVYETNPNDVYTIDAAAHLARVSRHLILVCCRQGLIAPLTDAESDGFLFDAITVRRLQRIGFLHDTCGINLIGVRMILDLADEVDRLTAERAEL